jgi:hypothetical protein
MSIDLHLLFLAGLELVGVPPVSFQVLVVLARLALVPLVLLGLSRLRGLDRLLLEQALPDLTLLEELLPPPFPDHPGDHHNGGRRHNEPRHNDHRDEELLLEGRPVRELQGEVELLDGVVGGQVYGLGLDVGVDQLD